MNELLNDSGLKFYQKVKLFKKDGLSLNFLFP